MEWDRISGNWTHWRVRVQERWGRLTNDQLEKIEGRRDRLLGSVQEAYGLTRHEAERQLRNWERGLAVEDDDIEFNNLNGRGPR